MTISGHAPSGGAGGRGAEAVATTSAARSRSGELAVVTTPQGLPIAIQIENSALGKEASVLADELFRLCRRSAMAAGVRMREQLVASGVARDVVDAMKLPRPDDLARAEESDDELDRPASWLRTV